MAAGSQAERAVEMGTKPMVLVLRTYTPLWAGDVNRECDRLHEAGLIGCLRWWFEAVVRGLGAGRASHTPVKGTRQLAYA